MQKLEHEWVTMDECCEYTRQSRWTIYRYIGRGFLLASQITPGGRVLISRRSIEGMLQRRLNRRVSR